MSNEDRRRWIGIAFVLAGVAVIVAGFFWTLGLVLWLAFVVGLLAMVGGALMLGGRFTGVVLVIIGALGWLFFYGVRFALTDEGARPDVTGWILLVTTAVGAAGCLVAGLVLLVRPRREGSNDRRETR